MATLAVGCGPGTSDPPSGVTEPTTSSTDTTVAGTTSASAVPPSDTGGPTTDTAADAAGQVPDVGGRSFACGYFAQDCPRGQKCVPCSDDGGGHFYATCCVDIVETPAGVGETCTLTGPWGSGEDSCDFGLLCWSIQDGSGECVTMCGGSADALVCPDKQYCATSGSGEYALCFPTCDPLTQTCDAGEGCYPIHDSFSCAPDASGRSGAHGDPCRFVNSCSPGSFCIGAEAHSACDNPLGCCAMVCDTTDPKADAMCAGLDPAQRCESWFVQGMAPEGYEDVGVCAWLPK